MGTLLALVAALCAFGSIVAAIKPALIGEESRFKAFAFCWGLAAISAMFGMAFDGQLGWGEVAVNSVVLLVLYALLTYIIVSRRVARMSPAERVRKLAELHQAKGDLKNYIASAKVELNIAPGQASQFFVYQNDCDPDADDERYLPKSYTPTPNDNRSGVIDRFEQSLTTLWSGSVPTVEFTYVSFDGERSRRQVDVDELVFNDRGQFYLRGLCHKRQEQRTFKVENIETQFKVGSRRYEFEEWCSDVLGLPLDVIDEIRSLDA